MRRDLFREITAGIPKMGDHRQEQILLGRIPGMSDFTDPEHGVVTYVNVEHRWYLVYFERLGFSCGYKFDDAV